MFENLGCEKFKFHPKYWLKWATNFGKGGSFVVVLLCKMCRKLLVFCGWPKQVTFRRPFLSVCSCCLRGTAHSRQNEASGSGRDDEQPGPSRRKRQPSMSESMPLYTLCKEDLDSMDKEVRMGVGGGDWMCLWGFPLILVHKQYKGVTQQFSDDALTFSSAAGSYIHLFPSLNWPFFCLIDQICFYNKHLILNFNYWAEMNPNKL